MKLQEWANENTPVEELRYNNGYWEQIIFVREQIPQIFCNSYEEYDQIRNDIIVISTHTSKSVTLPVFKVMLPGGIILIMRYNFHDWKISVISKMRDIIIDPQKLFDPFAKLLHFEGFKDEWIFGTYSESRTEFSVELNSGYYRLYCFLFLLAKNV